MTQRSIGNYEASWGEYGADEWSDAMVASMKLGGVDNLFFVSGSEIAFWQESVAKANEREWPAPRLITVTHEGVALNAAAGDAMVSGHPSATAVHVDVGTLNYGAAIHTAWRGSYPVLMTAGTGPRAFPGSMIGGREGGVQWVQEPRDQGEIVRQYTKLDHRLEHQDNPGLMISRLLQVAMSEPKGPVYLTVPRETAMLPIIMFTGVGALELEAMAFEAGAEHAEPWPDAHTIAAGMRVPAAIGDFLILRVVRESNGFAIAVDDETIEAARAEVASGEGLHLCPEGAATYAAYEQALSDGRVSKDETALLFNCGNGLKYPMPPVTRRLDCTKPIDYAAL